VRRWGVGHALVGYVAAFLLSNIAVGIYAGITGVDLADPTLGVAVVGLVGLWAGLLGTVAYVGFERFDIRPRPRDIPLGAVLGVVSQFGLLFLVYLPWRLIDKNLDKRLEEPAKDLTDLAHGAGLVVLAVLIVVGTPIVEELFFRGVLQGALLQRMRPAAAIAASSLAFGLAHQQVLQLPGLVAFGGVLGYLAWRTQRLGPSIVTHAAFNLATVLVLGLR
jgi:membrane protease YdiL (CAAX protease family)